MYLMCVVCAVHWSFLVYQWQKRENKMAFIFHFITVFILFEIESFIEEGGTLRVLYFFLNFFGIFDISHFVKVVKIENGSNVIIHTCLFQFNRVLTR
jgi:hypothetical protein